jgi:hypothetical protein
MKFESIAWPAAPAEAMKHLLAFMIRVVEELGISFSSEPAPDPVAAGKAYLAGEISEHDYSRLGRNWWSIVESTDTPKARLAISMLTATEEMFPQITECLSWFLEVLEMLGYDSQVLDQEMDRYFTST